MMNVLNILLVEALQQGGGGGGTGGMLVGLAIVFTILAGMWKVFTKAGQPGWAILVPIYNAYVFLKIAGRPGWWLILLLIPLVNLIVGIVVAIDIAKSFGKGTGFGIGLAFLGFVFYPVLGFGTAEYIGPAASEN